MSEVRPSAEKATEEFIAELLDLPWKPLLQTIPAHRPEEGKVGDCFRTAIACLLGAPSPEEVPHFAERNTHGWFDRADARKWLRETFGIDMMTVNLGAAKGYGVPYMVSVQSKTGPWRHLVIAIGDEVVHDPSGVGGYSLADAPPDDDAVAEVLCTMYDPDPDEMLRLWAAEMPDEAPTADDVHFDGEAGTEEVHQ